MYAIELSEKQKLIISELYTDFEKIKDFKEIIAALKVHQSTDWFWSFSDSSATLRHGENGVKTAQKVLMQFAEKTDNPKLMELAKYHPASKLDEKYESVIAGIFPWYPAYQYCNGIQKNSHEALGIQLSITGKLEEFNVVLNTMATMILMVKSSLPGYYSGTTLNNNCVEKIGEQTGISPNRLQSSVWSEKGISVPEEIYETSSAIATMARKLFKILDEIHFDYQMSFPILDSLDNEERIGVRHASINHRFDMLSVSYFSNDMRFLIPVMAVER